MTGGIVIATPTWHYPDWRYVESLLGLKTPDKAPWTFRRVFGKHGIDAAWNDIIAWFLGTSNEWMLHVDSDAVLHPNTMLRLLSWNEPLVSALAFKRRGPITPVAYIGETGKTIKEDGQNVVEFWIAIDEIRDWFFAHQEMIVMNGPVVLEPRPPDALLRVDRTGTHCLLVHREVYENISPPWFEKVRHTGEGSDFDFHAKAQAAGFTSWVDRSVIAGHLAGDWCFGALDFLAWDAIADWEAGEINIQIKKEVKENGTDDRRDQLSHSSS